MTNHETILNVSGLTKNFSIRGAFGRVTKIIPAIDQVSFDVVRRETLGIVGESGSGKSTIGKSLIGIHEPDDGRVLFNGESLLDKSRSERRRVARELQYIYQDPGASLDPRWKVGKLLHEPLIVHTTLSSLEREEIVQRIMEAVKLPLSFLERYPHELSGGQQRRVGLARTLTLNPSLIILDEPTSGLDVSVQAAVINLFKEMKERFDLTYIFISHDLSVVRILCDRVAVMYSGEIVEIGAVEEVFNASQHPYTKALLSAVPRIGHRAIAVEDEFVADAPPSESNLRTGCNFRFRCPYRMALCDTVTPRLVSTQNGVSVSCHKVQAAQ